MRKVIEIAYCDIDIARNPEGELVTATQLDIATPDGGKDMCDTCWKEYAELFLAFVSPENVLEGQAQAPLAVEAAPKAKTPHVSPEKGTPEYYQSLRDFADAQDPPIRYLYGKPEKQSAQYSQVLRRRWEENETRLIEMSR